MKNNVLVYLSGPITPTEGYCVEQNILDALNIHLELIKKNIPNICVHLAAIFPSCHKIDYETWMKYDFAVLDKCTHIFMLPRWETSRGAIRELEYAKNVLKIPIFDSIQDLCDTLN